MARVLPGCQMTIWKSHLDSVNTMCSCWLATVITETINLDDLEQAIRRNIRNRPDLPQDLHWKLENRVVKRSHQAVKLNQEWQPRNQKEVSVEAVHMITTAKDEERITMMMFAVWSHLRPMNQLPQCLFANVAADISGLNANPNPLRDRNFQKGMTDHLELAFKPSVGGTKRHKSFAKVEVSTIRDLDQRLPGCDNKSMQEMLRGVASCSGDQHRLIIQADHKVTDSDTVVVTCQARDADKVRVLMKR
jgi:hypothetical protein